MYKIYIDGQLLYADQNPDKEFRLSDPILTLRDNASGSLEFIVDSVNRLYSYIDSSMLKDVVVYKDNSDTPYWSGFITEVETDFFKRKHVMCVGDLQLLDRCSMHDKVNTYASITTDDDISIIAQNYIQTILDAYNLKPDGTTKMDTGHQILLGDVTVHMQSKAIKNGTTIRIVPYVTSCEETCLDALMNLQDSHGGHMRIRWYGGKRYLDWYADYPRQSSQVIRFGVNLLEFAQTADESKLFTVLYPVGDEIEDAEDINYTVISGTNTAGKKLDSGGNVVNADNAFYVRSNAVQITDNVKYYYSGHMLGNGVLWAVYDELGAVMKVEYSGATKSDEITTIDRREIDIPEEASTLKVAYYKDDETTFSSYSKIETALATDILSEHVTIESVNNGSPYIETALVSTYGWIEKHIFFEGVNTPQGVLNRANRYLSSALRTNLCIEVTAVDLRLMGVTADEIKMLDEVRIVSVPHNLDAYMPVTELKIPMAEPDKQTFTLGISFRRKLSDLVGRKLYE